MTGRIRRRDAGDSFRRALRSKHASVNQPSSAAWRPDQGGRRAAALDSLTPAGFDPAETTSLQTRNSPGADSPVAAQGLHVSRYRSHSSRACRPRLGSQHDPLLYQGSRIKSNLPFAQHRNERRNIRIAPKVVGAHSGNSSAGCFNDSSENCGYPLVELRIPSF